MYVIKLKNMFLLLVGIIVAGLGIHLTFQKSKQIETMANSFCGVIVVDAGHGLPDGGATNGELYESNINLAIAQKLQKELVNRGYEVVMTRKDENNIADDDKQSSISKMKQSDLNNRVKIINESNADFCISIHLNKFENSRYWGWQTFFNEKSEEGKKLAKCIQENVTKVIKKENKRTPLKIEGIKIVDKTSIPVVIVECGFLSNAEEANLLNDDSYQRKIVDGIVNGIEEYYQ